ncbi:MAG: restriction endonuclease subunit S [Muribaculaceae bacterium]|nr:restriction endonuclease subunit S [Muribaculaceae bacterium]
MTAEDLRKAILQQAIQGKLVPQDPNDEPASVLLERIREEKARLVKEKKIKKDKNESIIYRGEDNSHYEKILATGEIKCIDDEIPFDIPNTWEWTRMGNVGSWGAGSTPQRGNHEYYNNGTILWLKTGELNNDVVYDTSEKITEKALQECSLRLNKIGDVLIAMYGATIGKIAIVGKEMTTNQACCGCSPYNGLYNRYLFYYLMANKTTFIKQGEGGAQPNISRDKLINFLIPIPPLNEQKKIAQRIEDIQPLIDKYRIAQEQAEEMDKSLNGLLKKSVLQYAIQGKLVPQNSNEEPASALLEKIQQEKLQLVKEGKLKKKDLDNSVIFKGDDNKYYEKLGKSINDITDDLPFDIPNSWQWCRLSNIANLYTGNSINETEKKARYTDVVGTEYIATKDVWFDNSIDYKNGIAIPDKYIDDFRIAPANSVLMCIEGGSAGRKIGILSQDVCFGNKLCCFSPYADISEFIFYYLQSPLFFEIFSSNKNGIIGGVSVNNLKQLFIPLPPYFEIGRIVTQLKNILKGIEG